LGVILAGETTFGNFGWVLKRLSSYSCSLSYSQTCLWLFETEKCPSTVGQPGQSEKRCFIYFATTVSSVFDWRSYQFQKNHNSRWRLLLIFA
jgi:hypothetical protein